MTGEEQTDQNLLDDDENDGLDPELARFLDDDEADGGLEAYLNARRAAHGNPSPPQTKPKAKPELRGPLSARVPTLDPSIGTEMLLNNMIAECHGVMRHVAIPLAVEAPVFVPSIPQ